MDEVAFQPEKPGLLCQASITQGAFPGSSHLRSQMRLRPRERPLGCPVASMASQGTWDSMAQYWWLAC